MTFWIWSWCFLRENKTINLKCQALFSLKKKEKYFKVLSAVVVISALRVKILLFVTNWESLTSSYTVGLVYMYSQVFILVLGLVL